MEQTTPKRTVRVIPVTKSPAASAKKNVILRVAAYCRVSTDTEEQINSYEAQKAYYTQLIEENPEWEMAGVFADEGISGTGTKKRVEFNRMIAACKRGRIDLILTKSLSRFSRNTLDCLNVVRTLKAQGIGVIFRKGEHQHPDADERVHDDAVQRIRAGGKRVHQQERLMGDTKKHGVGKHAYPAVGIPQRP